MDDRQGAASSRRWVSYLVKSIAMVAFLFTVSKLAPMMPAWGIAVTWALLSLVPATGIAYHAVIDRTFNQKKFQKGVARFTIGRIACFIVAYAASAFCTGSLIVESPEWGFPMWFAIVLAVPLYVGVFLLVKRVIKKIYNPLFIESKTALASAIITGVLLFAVFSLLTCLQPPASYSCAADAFLAAPKPFGSSPSILMSEVGELTALVSGLTSYGLAIAAKTSYAGYIIWRAILEFGALSSIASMLAVCSIRPGELKRVFQQLGDADGSESDRPVLKSYIVASVMMPLLLIAGFVYADFKAGEAVGTEEYTKAQEFIRQQISLVVYEFDGKYYNPDVVSALFDKARGESNRLSAEAEEALVPLINASYDKRVENVDAYLDWYYSPISDWDQLVGTVKGNAEELARQKFVEHIESGIDDSELRTKLEYYRAQAEGLRTRVLDELARYEITEPYPDWLVTEVKPLNVDLSASIEPSRKLTSIYESIGIGLAGGAVSLIVAKKVDELLNREAYREELVAAINEEREEAIESLRSSIRAF